MIMIFTSLNFVWYNDGFAFPRDVPRPTDTLQEHTHINTHIHTRVHTYNQSMCVYTGKRPSESMTDVNFPALI